MIFFRANEFYLYNNYFFMIINILGSIDDVLHIIVEFYYEFS
jgi:hypothetical protein